MISHLFNWVSKGLSSELKFKIHRFLESVLGYTAAYKLKMYVKGGLKALKNNGDLVEDTFLFNRKPDPSFHEVGDGNPIDLISLWPPEIGGPSEIGPYLRKSLAQHFKVRTLVPDSNMPFRYTDSVLPLKLVSDFEFSPRPILAIVAFGNKYDSLLKLLAKTEKRDIYVIWHDPCLESSKREFLKVDQTKKIVRKYLVHSEAMKKHLSEYTDSDRIIVLRTGAPVYQKFEKREFPDHLHISFMGTVDTHKYCEEVFSAFLSLSLLYPQTEFLIAGHMSAERHHRYSEIISRNQLSNFKIYSYLPLEEWHRLCGSALISVNLRRKPGLESSDALMDQIASGTPTIISNVGSFQEIDTPGLHRLQDGVTPSQLTVRMISLMTSYMSNPAKWIQDSADLQAYASRHSMDNYAQEIFGIMNLYMRGKIERVK